MRNDVLQQVEDMIIQNNDYSLPADEGIKIHVPVQQFGILDFDQYAEIYRIGYETAMGMMDSIKSPCHIENAGKNQAAPTRNV